MQLSAEYRFNRCNNISGILSKNRPSTDALSALQRWTNSKKGRSYKIRTDEDEHLIAQLSWENNDSNAGPNLDDECTKSGVERHFVEK